MIPIVLRRGGVGIAFGKIFVFKLSFKDYFITTFY